MRIHIQNAPDDPTFAIDQAQWQNALDRAGLDANDYSLSFGDSHADLLAGLADAEAMITAVSEIAGRFPVPAPVLKIIFCTSAGVDKLAPFDWLPPGVALLNNRGTHGVKAGEYAIMALLMLANALPRLMAAQRAQTWVKQPASALAGRHLTVVGVGGLGGSAAQAARLFGMDITGVRTRLEPHPACDHIVSTDAIDRVLPTTEFLLIACPLTQATRNLIDRRRLSMLPTGAGVINIGRGALLDQDALCDLLDAGTLGGAVLDVFTPEPVPKGHRLWTTQNLVMTPHCSCDDPLTYNPRSLDIFLANLAAYRDGIAMPNQVDPTLGY
jgi:phosphoglycerate dehydrogenase-like enzyme